ncbi:MAG: CCA tRNA nucleotidyltransferase [Longimicrobiales bacterium]|nr:CCA tRNA nucleotidyltransferase [Longimicrobiales bacterium]
MDLDPPAAVRAIARMLEDAGYETWAVGGAVRDRVAGASAGDWDLATRATPDQVMEVFRRTAPIGVDHGTVGVLQGDEMYEVTTFRRDVETFGRHAVVEYSDSIEEDLSRRDFTINALAWHPLTGELLDPYDGARDLEAGRLRTVGTPGDRFAEDYLRVFRALRFAGQFDLEIEPATWEALTGAVARLEELSAERVREELYKVVGQVRTASRSLDLYREAGVLDVWYPELAAVTLEPPDEAGALWAVTLQAVDTLPPTRPTLRVATLLHAIGMPPARTKDLRGGWRYTGHEVLGGRRAEDVMRRLKGSNAEIEWVRRLVRHQPDLFPPDSPDPVVRRWLRHVGADLVNDLFRLRFALWRARDGEGQPDDLLERWATARRVLREDPPLDVGDLAIGGSELMALGLEPGPRFREILESLVDRVIEDPGLNQKETLVGIVRTEWIGE